MLSALYSFGFSDVFSESDSQSHPQCSCCKDHITLKWQKNNNKIKKKGLQKANE